MESNVIVTHTTSYNIISTYDILEKQTISKACFTEKQVRFILECLFYLENVFPASGCIFLQHIVGTKIPPSAFFLNFDINNHLTIYDKRDNFSFKLNC